MRIIKHTKINFFFIIVTVRPSMKKNVETWSLPGMEFLKNAWPAASDACDFKKLLATHFPTILHYVEDHPYSINLLCSMCYTVYHPLPIYDQGLMIAKLNFLKFLTNITQTRNCKHTALQQSLQRVHHPYEMFWTDAWYCFLTTIFYQSWCSFIHFISYSDFCHPTNRHIIKQPCSCTIVLNTNHY